MSFAVTSATGKSMGSIEAQTAGDCHRGDFLHRLNATCVAAASTFVFLCVRWVWRMWRRRRRCCDDDAVFAQTSTAWRRADAASSC
jgi:hypothetical protein